ncbi:MAG: PLP-dependent aminotransferase family protein [Rhodospirillales bacterium]|jgi:GntR family transcriptional regulator / MocR family aminotransferase|nr:PLP-dependent aminotransferase family protein [Rhodospirillales bacterium]MBT4039196.1 PLP-dependent aminotransferase family protein [Rhodospirillales bacterium]MBT4625609.1 PLP-dependent aminotransferase family protein [Rhodospirillales bacterium]MBT5351478.1 PLP-dependent aminotransferase family protein [Rhodospirillales bacterium]MBT5521439.1 PLP-dependent aminotransferase family protein [Rhodospirillales bacterium]
MQDVIFHLKRDGTSSIQAELRQQLVAGILGGQIPTGEPLPSSRLLAKRLSISRNTVSIVYQALVDDGYLLSMERRGFFVNPDIRDASMTARSANNGSVSESSAAPSANAPDWPSMFQVLPSAQRNINRPSDWQSYPYPFIYGQVDKDLFPIVEWRECSRQALGRKGLDAWAADSYNSDDPLLIEQIRTRLLPRRGIMADEDEILVTLGAQNALYLLSSLLVRPGVKVAMEEPGYQAARNAFLLKSNDLQSMPLDQEGLIVDERLNDCSFVYVTPSHHYPSTVTMSLARRRALLDAATDYGFVIIEDDYEFETNYLSEPIPALKSLDRDDRVIYVGSLSKSLFPGLRLGYMVGPRQLISEVRALRRLMLHHPPNNNQRTAALFMALGYHDTLIKRLHKVYRERWQKMGEALEKHLPNSSDVPSFGGTSYWVRGPKGLDSEELAARALEKGVVIEPGHMTFARTRPPKNFFRLAFSSISAEKIEPGIKIIRQLIDEM